MLSTLFAPQISILLFPIVSSLIVGLCGIFPLLIIPTELTEHLQSKAGSRKLHRLLSFGIGSMLGDVFLHLLPEAYAQSNSAEHPVVNWVGVWTIVGVLSFLIIEKLLVFADLGGGCTDSGSSIKVNGAPASDSEDETATAVQVEGYLNLFANFVDNLTHGLAVGSSYAVSVKVGLVTTFCILVHEVPHEISDFAILLRAGFHKWRAAKAQLLTASGSLFGALFAFTMGQSSSVSVSVSVVLPFTSGGFLYLALASLTPPILAETDSRESLLQVLCLFIGFASLYIVSYYL
ncbi:hypothetical protein BOX15_Mlig026714g1 [Macrostomum lignano]|uniref:Zinc transporter ZIP13 n=1 Tax=Macrostomum lignano TaxID=282301 RepID=A0A267G9F8_9PLAT|nr:hypothetical protein BOX15_Mlig026714g1 [Macrostomum lignano]